MADSSGISARLDRWGTALESAALVILLGAMMLLAVGQIVMRVVFSYGFVWADELIKLFVLWIALIASVAASRSNRHLRIDLVSHFVAEKYARFPRIVVDAFAALMCGILAWHSWRYVQISIEFGDSVLVDFPAWIAYSLLPLSFLLMCYRFLLSCGSEVVRVFKPGDPAGDKL
ncbi:MAG: TRAP transporter small permease [Proteobacteria bacterium]|nr:TRAP transporter small permease [Pseudomonadota bacterium]MDA0994021.1 TRAP transporter small permease [Pseudomonadota bacterium]